MTIDRRKALIVGVAILGALLLGWAVKAFFFTDPPAAPMTTPASIGSIEQTVLATGALEPVNLVSVGAQVSGQVTRLHVVLGQQVRRGQLIAEIDSAPQQNALRTAQASLNNVRAQGQQLQAGLAQAQLTFQRQAEMRAADATSAADYEAADAALKSAQAQLSANQAQVASAEVAVQSARLNLGYTRITAPIDGTVVAIVTREGQTVNANQAAPTIVKLGDLSTMTVKAEISEADVIKVEPGQRVYFTVLGDGDRRYNATLRTVEPAPESLETSDTISSASSTSTAIYYNGLFDVPNTDGRLRTFMTAQVSIVLAEAKDVLTIPAAALGARRSDGAYTIQVVDARGQAGPRAVRAGLNNGATVEIVSGLKVGERVVVGQSAPAGAAPAATEDRPGPPNAFGF